jgi:hypothetical protein
VSFFSFSDTTAFSSEKKKEVIFVDQSLTVDMVFDLRSIITEDDRDEGIPRSYHCQVQP